MNTAGYDSKFATLYYPWIEVMDPLTEPADAGPAVRPRRRRLGPHRRQPRRPQGAGQRGRARRQRRSSFQITQGEQGGLNPVGINCIRSFPGRGIRIWGARTLSSDPEWRYLNVRRLFNYIEESIIEGTQWVGVRAQRRAAVGSCGSRRSTRSSAASGATARCSARRPSRRSSSSATRRPTRPRSIDAGQVIVRDRHRAGEAGRVRGLPDQPVLGRRGRGRVGANHPKGLRDRHGNRTEAAAATTSGSSSAARRRSAQFREVERLDTESEIIEHKEVDAKGRPASSRSRAT